MLAALTLLLVVLLVVSTVLIVRPPAWLLQQLSRHHDGTLYIVATDRPAIALTIDDSPHPDVTPGILELLRTHNARATFFVIGSNAERYPELIEAIRADGHELANHLFEDRHSIKLSSVAFEAALLKTDSLIAVDTRPRWCRPGGGAIDARLIRLMRENDYEPCLASVYPLDVHLGETVARWQFMANIRPGAIVVLHDGSPSRRRSVRILEDVLPEVTRRGYQVTTVSDLIMPGDDEGDGHNRD